MDNHPIPQNVTGFKFKLIGDMTVKQFAYLASGAFFAWFFFIFPLPLLIKLPFSIFSGVFGIALAFFPVEGRPLDTMISYFVRALFIPDQYIYQKIGGNLVLALPVQKQKTTQTPQKTQEDLEAYLRFAQAGVKNKLDEKESVFFSIVKTLSEQPLVQQIQPSPVQQPPSQQVPLSYAHVIIEEEAPEKKPHIQPNLAVTPRKKPTPSATEGKKEEQTKEEQTNVADNQIVLLQQELEKTKNQLSQYASSPSISEQAHKKLLELEQQLTDVLLQKEQLQNQLVSLQKKFVSQSPTTEFVPTAAPIQQPPKKTANLPIPSAPNQITGLIRDSRGNVLPNILVEVKDSQGNPARAFKTNPIGQFSSSTPLSPGTYALEFEDPTGTHKFEATTVTVANSIIPPFEIVSEDEREKLRKALFN